MENNYEEHRTRADRIQKDIDTLGSYSSVKTIGCTLHLHKGICAGAGYIKREMEQAGLEVREDAVGR